MLISSLPPSPQKRFFLSTHALALSAPGVGGRKHNTFRLGAIITNTHHHILAAKTNLNKTHPKLLSFFQFPYLHAEAYCILSLGLNNCSGHTLYVLRILRNNHIALAKPCPSCLSLCRFVGLHTIFHTTPDGFEKIILN